MIFFVACRLLGYWEGQKPQQASPHVTALFYYHNEEYWISQNSPERYLTRSRGSITQVFQSTEELFENGRIEGKSLLEIWDDIKQYF